MILEPAPCKDCSDRYLGCHGKCPKYRLWRVKHDSLNKAISDTIEEQKAYDDITNPKLRYTSRAKDPKNRHRRYK